MLSDTQTGTTVEGLEIGGLEASEIGEALDVLSRGMRDNPIHFAAFSDDAEQRRKALHSLFAAAAEAMGWHEHMLVARRADGTIVGVCGMLPPGSCQLNPEQQARAMPTLLHLGPGTLERTGQWIGAWGQRDPNERHWHTGPLGVDAHLQGMGIGSALMRVFCARMDAAGETAYLETDKAINVRFYQRFGFKVVGEEEVLGVHTWFMLRRPRGRS